MNLIRSLSALLVLWCIALSAHAEGGCPSGMQPYKPSPNQSWNCMPIPGGGVGGQRQQPIPTTEQWEDRWGAIVGDKPQGILGFATGFPTEPAAQQAALADCVAKGGVRCKLENSYKNGCTAMTVGEQVYNIASRSTLDQAIASGIQKCREIDKDCVTSYSACSPPVRIR